MVHENLTRLLVLEQIIKNIESNKKFVSEIYDNKIIDEDELFDEYYKLKQQFLENYLIDSEEYN